MINIIKNWFTDYYCGITNFDTAGLGIYFTRYESDLYHSEKDPFNFLVTSKGKTQYFDPRLKPKVKTSEKL